MPRKFNGKLSTPIQVQTQFSLLASEKAKYMEVVAAASEALEKMTLLRKHYGISGVSNRDYIDLAICLAYDYRSAPQRRRKDCPPPLEHAIQLATEFANKHKTKDGFTLAFSLACKHVAGFNVLKKRKIGRPKNNVDFDFLAIASRKYLRQGKSIRSYARRGTDKRCLSHRTKENQIYNCAELRLFDRIYKDNSALLISALSELEKETSP